MAHNAIEAVDEFAFLEGEFSISSSHSYLIPEFDQLTISCTPTSAPGARLSRLPLARVKALVKADPDVTLAGQEAFSCLFSLQELFVETIAKDAYCCAQQGKRKTLQRRDLDNAIEAVDEFAFLEGTLD
nr:PREDICTED: DNA polymerase epsilon subunit 4 [Bos mutus]